MKINKKNKHELNEKQTRIKCKTNKHIYFSLFPHASGRNFKNALRFLTTRYLGKSIQQSSNFGEFFFFNLNSFLFVF